MAKTIGQLTQTTTIAGGDEFVIEQSGQTKRVAASVVRGGLVDADIDAAAAIAGSKLADGGIVTAKIADAAVTPVKLSQPYTLATAQNSTSGTSIDFTGIPSWAKRVTVIFSGVSTSGASNLLIQIGDSGGIEATGYLSQSVVAGSTNEVLSSAYTSGFGINSGSANNLMYGHVALTLSSSNLWVSSHVIGMSSSGTIYCFTGGGNKTLSATLDRVRITTVNGTDTFDAGEINISYEG